MDKKPLPLTQLPPNTKAKIIAVEGGYGLQRKLHVMGIRKGQIIKIVSRQPFRGPVTITLGGSQLTLGRGMAQKILVEVI